MTGFIQWLESVCADGASGNASSKRVVLLVAGVSLSVSALVLSFSVWNGADAEGELFAVCAALAGLAGVSYVGGKKVESGQ